MACLLILAVMFFVTYVVPVIILVFIVTAIFRAVKRRKKQKSDTSQEASLGSSDRLYAVADYIVSARASGMQNNLIEANLRQVGWSDKDIKDSFSFVDSRPMG